MNEIRRGNEITAEVFHPFSALSDIVLTPLPRSPKIKDAGRKYFHAHDSRKLNSCKPKLAFVEARTDDSTNESADLSTYYMSYAQKIIGG